MERYYGGNSDFNRAAPPLSLSIDDIALLSSPRNHDPLARMRHYDESMMLRYLFSGSSSSDENSTPRSYPAAIRSNQLHRLSSGSSSGGFVSSRGSPLSSLENVEISPLRRSSSAVKIVEDVLVVDAIPVRSAVRAGRGSRRGRMRTPFSVVSDSGGLSPPSSVTSYSGLRKREICRSWEDFGTCRYGAQCMFAHGKEEIDPRIINKTKSEFVHVKEEIDPRILSKIKSEVAHGKQEIDPHTINLAKSESQFAHGKEAIDPRITSKTKSEFVLGKEEINPRIINKTKSEINISKSPSNAFMYGQRSLPSDKIPSKANLKEKGTSFLSGDSVNLTQEPEQNRGTGPSVKAPDWSPLDDGIEVKGTSFLSGDSTNLTREREQNRETSPSLKAWDWSPLDDGIEVTLPYPAKNPPSQEAVDDYINRILYGPWPSEKKRLPVFEEICPNASDSNA